MSQLTEAAELRLEAKQLESDLEWSNEVFGALACPDDLVELSEEEPTATSEEALRDAPARTDVNLAAQARPPASPAQAPAAPAAPAPPRSPSLQSRKAPRSPGGLSRDWAMQPSLRGPDRNLRSAILELERLLRQMAPDDVERLLDYARRLVR